MKDITIEGHVLAATTKTSTNMGSAIRRSAYGSKGFLLFLRDKLSTMIAKTHTNIDKLVYSKDPILFRAVGVDRITGGRWKLVEELEGHCSYLHSRSLQLSPETSSRTPEK